MDIIFRETALDVVLNSVRNNDKKLPVSSSFFQTRLYITLYQIIKEKSILFLNFLYN